MNLPQGLSAFLAQAGWGDAAIEPLAGDASFRRYFRLRRADTTAQPLTAQPQTAMLMDAPPPEENPVPFLRAAQWLDENGLRAPRIYAADEARGLRWFTPIFTGC
ncbi:MAG: hypothetical protein RLY97_1643, partial [Pseudomonadota bacterium]